MELVYLWVEKYKNIENQGFNFSPRFECEFDGKNLTINEKEDYVSIFPENINITAIVGENGSGKSGIIKFIAEYSSLFFNKKFDYFLMSHLSYIMIYYSKNLEQIFIIWSVLEKVKISNYSKYTLNCELLDSFKSDEYVKLLKERNYNKIIDFPQKERENDSFNKECFSKNITGFIEKSFILHYDYSFDLFTHYENYNSCILSVPNKEYDIYHHHCYDKTLIIEHLINKNYIDENQYFEPYKISIIPLKNIIFQFQHKDKLKIKDFILHLINSQIFDLLKDKYKKIIENTDLIHNPTKLAEFINENLSNIKKLYIEQAMKEVPLSYEIEELINYLEILKKSNFNNIFEIDSSLANINVNIEYITQNNINLLTYLPSRFFKLKILSSNNADYDDLSNGEKAILRIRFYIEKVIKKYKKDNYFILLDEADNELHPQWQKKLLHYLISIFKNRNQTFHFIISSHSPFILSDLPKENVIFLENGKQVNPDITQTFGANIHTLLSNGFFMRDGLMGEFAKSKINKIKDFYEKVKKSKNPKKTYLKKYDDKKKYFENIQKIIGEPFLQKIIKNYLDELEEIFDDETYKNRKKEELLKQFSKEELQKYLDEKK